MSAGFYGKIPARGDFVRAGLPRGFVEAWDSWLQRVIPASAAILGEGWRAAWLVAPIWRFALPAGVCGAEAALGVWMASVDRAGRYFPLVLARTADRDTADLLAAGGPFLDAAEAAGLDAVRNDLTPESLAERVEAALRLAPGAAGNATVPAGSGLWWTEDARSCRRMALPRLPEAEDFTAMLDAGALTLDA